MTDAAGGGFGGHSVSELEAIAHEEIPGDATPGFAVVAGSHMYGWPDPESDVDLRGFHVADGERYALLERPDEQVSATFTSRDAGVSDVDFVSYELRKFGVLVADRNFNALEALFEGALVLESPPAHLDALRSTIQSFLPMDVPARYAGMAASNRDAVESGGGVKRVLYAVRGLLAANYVAERGEVLTDVRALSEEVLGDTAVVDDLVAAKRSKPDATLDTTLTSQVESILSSLEIDTVEDGDASASDVAEYRRAVDEWMREVRGW